MSDSVPVYSDDTLLRSYSSKIFGFALAKLGHRQDAEDLAQEIAVQLHRSLNGGREIGSMDAWVHRICCYTWSNYLAKHKRHWQMAAPGTSSIDESQLPSGEPSALARLETKETLHLLQREVALLSKLHREITVMYYFDGLSVERIAVVLRIPPGTVKWHLSEARKKLKEGIGMTGQTETLSFKPMRLGVGHCGTPGPLGEPNSYFTTLLAGNIAIAAYEQPLTIGEIARKVGAASAYVEECIDKLKRSELVRSGSRGKYQTNFIIRTIAGVKEEYALKKAKSEDMAADIHDSISSRLGEIRKLGFLGCEEDDAFLLWTFIPFAVNHQYWRSKESSYYENNGPIERPDGGRYIAVGNIWHDNEKMKAEVPDWEIVRRYFSNGIKSRNDGGSLHSLQMDTFWSGGTWREFDGPDLTDHGRMAAITGSGAELTSEFDKLTAARLAQKGYISILDGRPAIRIPFMNKEQHTAFIRIIEDALESIDARSKLEPVHDGVAAVWARHIPTHISKQEVNYFATNQGSGIVFAVMEALVRFGKLEEPADDARSRLTTMVWEQ